MREKPAYSTGTYTRVERRTLRLLFMTAIFAHVRHAAYHTGLH